MEDKEKVIVKQAILKASVHLVSEYKKDNLKAKDLGNEVIDISNVLFDWVFKDINKSAAKPTTTKENDDPVGFEPKCPACDSFVWDNRETASSNQPKWRCKNEECTGGSFSKKYNRLMAWASWDSDEFANAGLIANAVEDKVSKVNGAGVIADNTETEPPF